MRLAGANEFWAVVCIFEPCAQAATIVQAEATCVGCSSSSAGEPASPFILTPVEGERLLHLVSITNTSEVEEIDESSQHSTFVSLFWSCLSECELKDVSSAHAVIKCTQMETRA